MDLSLLHSAGLLGEYGATFAEGSLNAFMALGRPEWRAARARLQALFAAPGEEVADAALMDNAAVRASALVPLADVAMQLPASIGDYTDFYSSREHATNVGVMFRGKDNALQPNWCVAGAAALAKPAGCTHH